MIAPYQSVVDPVTVPALAGTVTAAIAVAFATAVVGLAVQPRSGLSVRQGWWPQATDE